jgi:hypothetical protein
VPRVEIDQASEAAWSELLPQFADASVHQTWSMGRVEYGDANLSHLVLRRDDEVTAMAQVMLRRLPLGGGVATVYWGPLWQRKGIIPESETFDQAVAAIKHEYVTKRGMLLRLWPAQFILPHTTVAADIESILARHNFVRNRSVAPYRTLLVDLEPPVESVRNNFGKKWRNQLNAAEKAGLELVESSSDDTYLTFLALLGETVSRKQFSSQVDYLRYRRVQNDLSPSLKMKIVVCSRDRMPAAAGVFSAIGNIGTYLLGATGNSGLRTNGSNLIHWTVIKWLKDQGCRWYDLGGIDPTGNPGVYHFKKGIAGKTGVDAAHLGQFYLATSMKARLLNVCMTHGSNIRSLLRRMFR